MKKALFVVGALATTAVGVGLGVARFVGNKAMPEPQIPTGWERYQREQAAEVTVVPAPKVEPTVTPVAKKAAAKKAAPAKKAVAKKAAPAAKKAAPAKKAPAKKAVASK